MSDRKQLLNDLEEAMRTIFEGDRVTLWTALPGILVSVNFTEMTCEVQPAIQSVQQLSDGSLIPVKLPVLVDVPLVFPGGGGYALTFPLAAGNEVLVIFAARCIDAWWQSGGVQQAMEARMHDLSDAFAIPNPRSQPNVLPSISHTDVQLRNEAGTTFVSLTPAGKVKIKASAIEIDGAVTVTGEVTANGIHLSTHTHPVTTAPGTTGVPIP